MSRQTLTKCCRFVKPLLRNDVVPCSFVSQRWIVGKYLGERVSEKQQKKWLKEEESKKWADSILNYKGKQEGESEKSAPHMLHAVWRVQSLRGRPWWEKQICEHFGLDQQTNKPVVVKNTPEENKKLMEIKHLVRILPVTFPHGLPEHESDFEHTLLDYNGRFSVKKTLKHFEPPKEEEGDTKKAAKWDLKKETVKKYVMRKKELYDLHSEYHQEHHKWELNEDGKEYRYNHQKVVRKYKY